MNSVPEASHVNLVDAQFVFEAIPRLCGSDSSRQFQYAALQRVLDQAREGFLKFGKADKNIVFCATRPDNDGQRRFIDMLQRSGFLVENLDYRDTYVTMSRVGDQATGSDAPAPQSLSPAIAYALGLIGARRRSSVVVVSGAFDLHKPLRDLAENREVSVAVAFFRSCLDPRWARQGRLFDKPAEAQPSDAPGSIGFFNLEDAGLELLGVDLKRFGSVSSTASSGGLRSL